MRSCISFRRYTTHPVALASVVLTLIAGMTTSALAQWVARVNGPDVFGTTTVIAATSSMSGDGLVVQCDTDNLLALAYISPATPSMLDKMSQSAVELPATLLIKAGSGPAAKLDAHLKQWNNKFVGVVVEGRTPDILAVVHAIGAATSEISVGVEVFGQKQSESFESTGSTSAIDTAARNCKLGEVGAKSKDNAAAAQ